MILKLLLVIGVIATVYFMFIKKKRPSVKTKQTKQTKQNRKKTPSNEMIECETCGIYCDIDESILSGSKYYCSKDCIDKG